LLLLRVRLMTQLVVRAVELPEPMLSVLTLWLLLLSLLLLEVLHVQGWMLHWLALVQRLSGYLLLTSLLRMALRVL